MEDKKHNSLLRHGVEEGVSNIEEPFNDPRNRRKRGFTESFLEDGKWVNE